MKLRMALGGAHVRLHLRTLERSRRPLQCTFRHRVMVTALKLLILCPLREEYQLRSRSDFLDLVKGVDWIPPMRTLASQCFRSQFNP
jgi:hypothetical protein